MATKLECKFGDKTLTIETGKVARQANGAVMVRCGDTIVLVTATGSKEPRANASFFPLTVDYQEKFYAAGRIPGGFFKREARPSGKATLTARLIDRPLRPLFPKKYFYDVHVVATTLSVDGENEPDLLALIGASCALTVSDIPFAGPVAALRVGRIDGKFVCNPTPEQQKNSDIEFLVSGTKDAITMVEGGAKIVPEKDVLEAILFAHKSMQPIITFQEKLRSKCGKEKKAFTPAEVDASIKDKVEAACRDKFKSVMHVPEKLARYAAIDVLRDEVVSAALENVSEEEQAEKKAMAKEVFGDAKKKYAREYTLTSKKRIDQRASTDVREITIDIAPFPRTHGSAIFTRGETQAIAVVTLGTGDDEQRIDSIEGESKQTFMLHYNFPPFSVGEAGFLRGPGRREIGHGSLALRALECILPSQEKFPYVTRIVAEITESNGSSSMATVCGGSLALMDAGVPIQAPVAGIAMGLIKEGDKHIILSDILGDEDGFGDMDFKVAGTEKGVTALQMDIKSQGITKDVMAAALAQAREGRLYILGKMKEAIAVSREDLSPHAPRIEQITVPKDKIRDVIGSGGKTIRGIIELTGAKVDVNDDGVVSIASADKASLQKAVEMVKAVTADAEIGKEYDGTVKKIMDFGAFVEILPGKDGLVHISEIAHERVERVTDHLKEGDKLRVVVLDVDRGGKIRLSRKALLEGGPPAGSNEGDSGSRSYDRRPRGGGFNRDRGPRRDFGRGSGGGRGSSSRSRDDKYRGSGSGGGRRD